jgi:hypothetical protein
MDMVVRFRPFKRISARPREDNVDDDDSSPMNESESGGKK